MGARPKIRIDFARRTSRRLPRELIIAIVRDILRRAGRPWEVSIAVVGDDEIAELNKRYLRKSRPTDVLAFRLDDETEPRGAGQIVISADTAAREAVERGIPFRHEIALYAAHAALHLLGHPDATEKDREEMARLEAEALARFGIPRHGD